MDTFALRCECNTVIDMTGHSWTVDWALPRMRPAFTGFSRELDFGGDYLPGTVLRCVNGDRSLPCTLEEFNKRNDMKARVSFTIVGIAKCGDSKAPFKKAKDKDGKAIVDKSAKPLAEMQGKDAVKIYSFMPDKSNYNKGPRNDDEHFTVQVGQTMTVSLKEFMYDGEKNVFANNHGDVEIPPFAVMDVVVSPTKSSEDQNGYGVKFNRIVARHKDTLYSYLGVLKTFPSDPASAAAFNEECAVKCDPIKNNIDRSRNAMHFKVPPTSFVSKLRENLPFVSLVGGDEKALVSGVDRVDISVADLCRFANIHNDGTEDAVQRAICFCDWAIAASAATVWVIRNEYFKVQDKAFSEFRGVLLINADVLLDYVNHQDFPMLDDGESDIKYPLDYSLGDLSNIRICVNVESIENQESEIPVPCVDFPMVDPKMRFQRGYEVFLQDQTDDSIIANMVFNASPVATMGSHFGAPLLGARVSYKRKIIG